MVLKFTFKLSFRLSVWNSLTEVLVGCHKSKFWLFTDCSALSQSLIISGITRRQNQVNKHIDNINEKLSGFKFRFWFFKGAVVLQFYLLRKEIRRAAIRRNPDLLQKTFKLSYAVLAFVRDTLLVSNEYIYSTGKLYPFANMLSCNTF